MATGLSAGKPEWNKVKSRLILKQKDQFFNGNFLINS